MPSSRSERRRRARLTEPVESVETDETEEESEPARARRSTRFGRLRVQSNVIWALVTGLAVGYAIGREVDRFGGSKSEPAAGDKGDKSKTSATGKSYASESEFPAGWVKHGDLTTNAAIFAGLSEPQTAAAMQALNERNCECGCSFGTLANCLHKDPNCPRSPTLARLAVDLAKQGKSASEIEEAIDSKQKEMGGNKPAAAQQPAPTPTTPQKIALAAHNPRKGPKDPKVTIVEFSDFQ